MKVYYFMRHAEFFVDDGCQWDKDAIVATCGIIVEVDEGPP